MSDTPAPRPHSDRPRPAALPLGVDRTSPLPVPDAPPPPAPLPPAPLDEIVIRHGGVVLAGRQVLAPLDLRLTERRIGIVGRNGSGKTTLLRLIAGLIASTSGGVTLGGADPYRDRRAALTRVGILFQNADHQILFPMVEEELAFGLTQLGQSKAKARAAALALLQAEGRSHWQGVAVSTLSGGQKQWLCLMAVLLMRPGTILLDEPYSGLDLPTALRLRRRLAALPQRLITISHDPAAFVDCERLLWLEAGHLVQDGPAADVLQAYGAAMAELGAQDADADLAG